MPIRVLIGLLLCNLIWSANPIMSKLLLADYSPPHASLLRYGSALLSFALWAVISKRKPRPFARPRTGADGGWLAGLGLATFCFSPLLQMQGLSTSQAVDNALIVAMEPLITVVMAWMIVGEKLGRGIVLSFAIALTGFSLLSGLTPQKLGGSWDPHLFGNVIIALSLVGEGVYSSFARRLMPRFDGIAIFGFALTIGVAGLAIAVHIMAGPIDLTKLHAQTWLALLWLGPLGTTVTYLYWMKVLPQVSIAAMALTLFLQPLAGSLWGTLFLGERLDAIQAVGGGLILLAVCLNIRTSKN